MNSQDLRNLQEAYIDVYDNIMEREDSPYEKASDAALDARYGYGRAQGDKRSFGRAANRSSAAAALRALRRGERSGSGTSREAGSDAVHQGWAKTAKTSTDQTPEKKAKRAKLADTPYSKLPDDEKEKDRVSFDAVRAVYNRRNQREDFELWVNNLLDEGYDLSGYTWDELYENYQQLNEISPGLKRRAADASVTKVKKARDRYQSDVDPNSTHPYLQARYQDAVDQHKRLVKAAYPPKPKKPNTSQNTGQNLKAYNEKRTTVSRLNRAFRNSPSSDQQEQVDIYDIILSHLLDEGYAETLEQAEVIMVNMSEEWRESVVEATVLAAKGGVAGAVQVKQTKTPGFLGTGFGSKTVSTPIPGTFTRNTPGRVQSGPRPFDAYGSGSKGAEAEMSDRSGPTDAERNRYNAAVTKNNTLGDGSEPSPRAVNQRAYKKGHSGLMPTRDNQNSTTYTKPNQSWRGY